MRFLLIPISVLLFACGGEEECDGCDPQSVEEGNESEIKDTLSDHDHTIEPVYTHSLVVLGNCQDAGSPQINCHKACCEDLHSHPDPHRKVVSLGVIDPYLKEKYIFEATPDFPSQLSFLSRYSEFDSTDVPNGIFLTHAHIGHYTGLMYLGKEAMNANKVPVYAMPKMFNFLKDNGPWSQLVANDNIELREIAADNNMFLSDEISVEPFLVPHRDEYSETVGYKIYGPTKVALFIPDIDKWEKWDRDIIGMIKDVNYAFLDATFYDGAELPNRDMSEVPHPFVEESMKLFDELPAEEKDKIYFIHFNHTNPLLNDSPQKQEVEERGYHIAEFGQVFDL